MSTLDDELAELRRALLELRATVLAVLITPRAFLTIALIGFALTLFGWFALELIRSVT